MRAYKSAVFALVAFTLKHGPWGAGCKTVEITPYVALSPAAASPVGAIVTFPVTSTLSVETDEAYRRRGHINALSSSISLLYFLPRFSQATPYVVGGVEYRNTGRPFSPPTVRRRHRVARGPDSDAGRPEDANE